MSTKDMRVGVIGRGFGDRVVAPAFDQTDRCRVVGVVSPRDAGAVAELCSRRDVDLISVHSPPFLHLDNVRRAIDGGHAVLCDKPFGRNAGEAAAMCDMAAAAGRLNFLNFELRCDPVYERLRELLKSGAAGELLHVHCSIFLATTRVPLRPYGWLFDSELGGGWTAATGTHLVDFLLWTLGDISEASARRSTTIAERPDSEGRLHRCSAEDGFTAMMRTASGVSIALDSTSAAAANVAPRMISIGADAVLELVEGRRILRRDASGVTEIFQVAEPWTSVQQMRRWAGIIRDSLHDGAVAGGAATFADGLACAEVIDRLRE